MRGLSLSPITITLANGTPAEEQTRDTLLTLLRDFALDKWRYAETVQIEAGVIPHSHPRLTLSTQHRDRPEHLLADYIHEQLHWFTLLQGTPAAPGAALEEFRQTYPALPIALPEGCGSEFSNYLHVLVCYLEYLGLCELIGAERAYAMIAQRPYYNRIYGLVLNETERIVAIVARHGVTPPMEPPTQKRFREASGSGDRARA